MDDNSETVPLRSADPLAPIPPALPSRSKSLSQVQAAGKTFGTTFFIM